MIRKAERDPHSPGSGLVAAGVQVAGMLYQRAALRRRLLRTLLDDEYDIPLRDDSRIAESYVTKNDVSLREAVAVIRITSHLFSYGHAYWSENHEHFEKKVRDLVWSTTPSLSWEAAADSVIASELVRVPQRRFFHSHREFRSYGHYDDDDDDDDEESDMFNDSDRGRY